MSNEAPNLPGYSQSVSLYVGPDVQVLRAYSEALRQSVILKFLTDEFPPKEQIEALEREFEFLREDFGSAVPRALALERLDRRPILVMEDIGGEPLSSFVASRALGALELLDVILKIAQALSAIHERGVVHCDIKPENIVFNRETGRLQICDFGAAIRGGGEHARGFHGSPSHISPEQTGRTQHAVDYRSDYYSLGITIYQLFTGRLPFTGADQNEWVHAQLVQVETPIHEVNPSAPLSISQIAQKLMKKYPGDRYQSGLGLLHDLELCRESLHGAEIGLFEAGRKDLSAELKISEKLYGREHEIERLTQIFRGIVEGGKHVVMIEGEAGTGKSSLVETLRNKIASSSGRFLSGKFDQFRKDVPFSALIHAFNELITQVLGEEEAEIEAWRQRIQRSVGENVSVLTQIIPRLELIIGKPALFETVRDSERRQRFQQAFHSFMRACCQCGRPLVIFMDDLQWADAASRALIETLLSGDAESLLFIGAFRPGYAGGAIDPLQMLVRDLREKEIPLENICLLDLELRDVEDLVKDTFKSEDIQCRFLARVVHDKTKGNPFFLGQFLKELYEKKYLRFHAKSGWSWDPEKIRDWPATANVLELLGRKIESLPEPNQKVVCLAACFGSHFMIGEFSAYNDLPPAENARLMAPAVQMGLVVGEASGKYRFIHDRVQEAAYRRLSEAERQSIHWKIANRILASWSEDKIRDGIFYLVNHWNAGAALLSTEEERRQGAELNRLAAQRSKDSSVYDMAMFYSAEGVKWIGATGWSSAPALTTHLYSLLAESSYVMGRFDESERLFRDLLEHARTPLEKARTYRKMVYLAYMMGRHEQSLEWGASGLELLGFQLPRKISKLKLLFSAVRIRALKRRQKTLDLNSEISDENLREVSLLLKGVAESAYFVDKLLFAFVGFTSLRIVLQENRSDILSQVFYTALLWQRFKDYAGARESAEIQLKIMEAGANTSERARAGYILSGMSLHVLTGLRHAQKQLEIAYEQLTQIGDLPFCGWTLLYLANVRVLAERKLETADEALGQYLGTVRQFGDRMIDLSLLSLRLAVQNLAGETLAPDTFSTESLSEEDLERDLRHHASPNPWAWYASQKLFAHYLMGQHEKALTWRAEARRIHETSPFSPASVMNRIFETLVLLANDAKLNRWEKVRARLQARAVERDLRKLARLNPSFGAPAALVRAELNRSRGRYEAAIAHFEQAITLARAAEIPLFEALANERAAHVFFLRGSDRVGTFYMREALFLYQTWGAEGKARLLIEKYPELRRARVLREPGSSLSGSTTTFKSAMELDLNAVLKATNSLISEMNLTRLIEKLLRILTENAGAERGLLALNEGGKWRLRGDLRSGEEFALSDEALESFRNAPGSILGFVMRSGETKILNNAMEDPQFQRDEFVQDHKVRSVICVPILAQNEVKGLVYLENNRAPGVFTEERVELVRILASQASISLENARLYGQQAEKIRMQNELITAQAVQERLFPKTEAKFAGARVSGFYNPATECGGDWWYCSEIGDWIYVWIGDATGHGAPAALVTSAACSAVSVIEKMGDSISPEKAMEYLNNAIFRTTKGQIHMTFFVGALNKSTGEFRYSRASHDPPVHVRRSNLNPEQKFSEFRQKLDFLIEPNGSPLGREEDLVYSSGTIQLQPGDHVILYTDGLSDRINLHNTAWGDREFMRSLFQAYKYHSSPKDIKGYILQKCDEFADGAEVLDDITVCILEFTGAETAAKLKKTA